MKTEKQLTTIEKLKKLEGLILDHVNKFSTEESATVTLERDDFGYKLKCTIET